MVQSSIPAVLFASMIVFDWQLALFIIKSSELTLMSLAVEKPTGYAPHESDGSNP